MISSYSDLQYYLACDKASLGITRRYPRFMSDDIWRFEILMRWREYLTNVSKGLFCSICFRIADAFLHYLYKRRSIKLGFSIPLNTFGPGLAIVHYGTIVVAENSVIGCNCRIHEGVTLGATNKSFMAPILGDNVFIGSGAKIIGNVHIASNTQIAANAVVIKDIEQVGTWGGVPAKLISANDSSLNLIRGTELVSNQLKR